MRGRDEHFATSTHLNIYSRLAERERGKENKREEKPHYSGLATLVTLISAVHGMAKR